MSDFWGYVGPVPKYKRYFTAGPVHMSRVPSWNAPTYSRFGAWRYRWGFSLRFRAYVFVVSF